MSSAKKHKWRQKPLIVRNIPALLKKILAEIDSGLTPELDLEIDREMARAHVNEAAFSGLAIARERAANYGLDVGYLDVMEETLELENKTTLQNLERLINKMHIESLK